MAGARRVQLIENGSSHLTPLPLARFHSGDRLLRKCSSWYTMPSCFMGKRDILPDHQSLLLREFYIVPAGRSLT